MILYFTVFASACVAGIRSKAAMNKMPMIPQFLLIVVMTVPSL
jgi:hypothetical protein